MSGSYEETGGSRFPGCEGVGILAGIQDPKAPPDVSQFGTAVDASFHGSPRIRYGTGRDNLEGSVRQTRASQILTKAS